MRVIPVIDLKGGQAVHAIAGDRAYYRPLRSVLHPEADPLELARAIRDRWEMSELYLADLDAIAEAPPALDLYRSLRELGLAVWVDAGVRQASDVATLFEAGVDVVIVGLETVDGPEALAGIMSASKRWAMPTLRHPHRLAFSLDLRYGHPLVPTALSWGTDDPIRISGCVIEHGLRRLIVLDLARVGTGQGLGTEAILRELRGTYPEIELIAGGGIAGAGDLDALARCGVDAILIGSALHDGRIDPGDHGMRRRH